MGIFKSKGKKRNEDKKFSNSNIPKNTKHTSGNGTYTSGNGTYTSGNSTYTSENGMYTSENDVYSEKSIYGASGFGTSNFEKSRLGEPVIGTSNFEKSRFGEHVIGTSASGESVYGTQTFGTSDVGNYIPVTTIPPKVRFKRLVEKKLTIILVENTKEVVNQKDTLVKIVKSSVPTGLVCVIKYGSFIRQSKVLDISSFDDKHFISGENVDGNICLYDALESLEKLVNSEYMAIKEGENERERINQIEIIGIGNCKDIGSKISKDCGIQCFYRAIQKTGAVTKCFCLTEEGFVNSAEIGFHSIGSINRDYQQNY